MLNRDFPRDPDILYLTVHTYSDLSLRASQALLFTNPAAYQVHQLNAEAMEAQEKWDEAAEEYRMVLEDESPAFRESTTGLAGCCSPNRKHRPRKRRPGKNSKKSCGSIPSNAGAEFVLAELARQAENYPEAIDRFTRATKLDAMFADAFIGLGRSLLDARKGGGGSAAAGARREAATR